MKGFIERELEGQRWLQPVVPGTVPPWDIRLFLRGPMLDNAQGSAEEMRRRLLNVLGADAPLIAPRQVHETTILQGLVSNTLPRRPDGDGILLTTTGLEASLRFADCAPVVVASPEESWVLLLHSGYKGTVRNIVREGIAQVIKHRGRSVAESVYAWVGPCICGRNYPRDKEDWTQKGLAAFHPESVQCKGEKVFFDIPSQICRQLKECGIAEERVFLSETDTSKNRDICYSYRGGDSEDRMFLWAKIRHEHKGSAD